VYKVTYCIGTSVKFKTFETLNEACVFMKEIATGDVLEIKLEKEKIKKEDRT
jgi:hypothetical protein